MASLRPPSKPAVAAKRPAEASEYPPEKRALDPLRPVLDLGTRHHGVGLAIGLAGALTVHGAAAGTGLHQLYDMQDFAAAVRTQLDEDLRAVYDVEVDEPAKPEPEPEPEPAPDEPEPDESEPVQPPQAEAEQEPAEPPPAAEVGQALTAEPDPNEPLDLTGEQFTMVTGPGTRYRGGISQRGGTAKEAVRDRRARATEKPNAPVKAKRSRVAKRQKRDLSRPAGLVSSTSWNSCGFPAEADLAQINAGRVTLIVTVGADNRPTQITVASETPTGYGFGQLARTCAFQRSWRAGLDSEGNSIASTTPPINVNFSR